MNAKYLIRMDDACHTMDARKWQRMEQTLDQLGIRPIVAVVPENKDLSLMIDPPDGAFWDKVRAWQAKGWTIAMHGYTHVMHYTESRLILPYYKRSEFAGLSYEDQAAKIKKSWQLFKEQGIELKIWIAPAHCFDIVTLKAIHDETNIRVVSDGIAFDVYYEYDFFWIPQQIWELAERRSGLWTVCLHPNMMTLDAITAFGELVKSQFRNRIISFEDVNLTKQKKSLSGWIYNAYFWSRRHAMGWLLSTLRK